MGLLLCLKSFSSCRFYNSCVILFIADQKNLNPLGGIGFLLGLIFHSYHLKL